jgi:hypothetical protein
MNKQEKEEVTKLFSTAYKQNPEFDALVKVFRPTKYTITKILIEPTLSFVIGNFTKKPYSLKVTFLSLNSEVKLRFYANIPKFFASQLTQGIIISTIESD